MKATIIRLRAKKTWVKIYLKSGGTHLGQIQIIRKEIFTLTHHCNRVKKDMRIILRYSAVEAIECLECENSTVWATQ
ncbi:MAG: hypothetical protein KAU50_04490 [Candidatus Marinimicrobia bacterium]|nr:hypothetical protein [Candidatus Neomarinimicrobiota bacterium]